MDKKSSQKKQKRQSKMEDNCWDCSVCTFRNTAEAFKCAMCDVRKGTSTRKPRLNPQLVAQQVAQQHLTAITVPKPPVQRREGSKEPKAPHSTLTNSEEKVPKKKVRNIRPRLKNVDRTQFHRQPVTVNNVTVVITEFLPKITTNSSPQNPVTASEIPTSPPVSSSNSEITTTGDHIHPGHTS